MPRQKRPKRALSLRTRFTLFLGLSAASTSTVLSIFTYTSARNYLLEQRGDVARVQTFLNASGALNELRFGDPREIGAWAIENIYKLMKTADHKEAAAAFVEKRRPVFVGG